MKNFEKYNGETYLLLKRRRRETVERTDLSPDLTGALLVLLIIDGHIWRVERKSAHQARVTRLWTEEQDVIQVETNFLLLGDALGTKPRRRQELVPVEPAPDGVLVVQGEEDGVRTALEEEGELELEY